MPIMLTPDEIAALQAERTKLIANIAKRTESIANQDDVVQAATDADNAQKKVFNFYDSDIILRYENEREAQNGLYIGDRVTTAEFDLVGQLDTAQRLFPTFPQTAPIRIDQFDDGNQVSTDNLLTPNYGVFPGDVDSEQYWITRQAEVEDWLVNGLGGTSPTITPSVVVLDPVNSTTTEIEIDVTTPSETPDFNVGDRFLIISGGQQVGVEVISVTPSGTGTCSNPSYLTESSCTMNGGIWTPLTQGFTLGIVVLTPGSVGAGGTIDPTWNGFNNSSRIAKVDSVDGYTYLLNQMVLALEEIIGSRIAKLDLQIVNLDANEDPGLDAQAKINANTSKTFLNNWLITSLISDAALATLATERGVRSPQIAARITAIGVALMDFFDPRYIAATDIADTGRGTARIKFFRIDVQDVSGDLLASDQARKQAIEDLFDLAGVPY